MELVRGRYTDREEVSMPDDAVLIVDIALAKMQISVQNKVGLASVNINASTLISLF